MLEIKPVQDHGNFDYSHGTNDFPFIYDQKTHEVHVGPRNTYHTHVFPQYKYGDPDVYMGRADDGATGGPSARAADGSEPHIYWYRSPHPSEQGEVEHVLGQHLGVETFHNPWASVDEGLWAEAKVSTDLAQIEEVNTDLYPEKIEDQWTPDRRALIYDHGLNRLFVGGPGSSHRQVYEHFDKVHPDWDPDHILEGSIDKNGSRFWDDGYVGVHPARAYAAIKERYGVNPDPSADQWSDESLWSEASAANRVDETTPANGHYVDSKVAAGWQDWEEGWDHPDLKDYPADGMPDFNVTPGNPNLPLYRYVHVEHNDPEIDRLMEQGQHSDAFERMMPYIAGDRNPDWAGHSLKNLGMHWTHDPSLPRFISNQNSNGAGSHGVILRAEHPGLEHTMSWDNPQDAKLLHSTVFGGPDAGVHPEVAVRPNAPMNINSAYVMDDQDKWNKVPIRWGHFANRHANILDPVHDTLPPLVWDEAGSPTPKLKPHHNEWITREIHALCKQFHPDPEKWLRLVLTGSLTTYQYSNTSDCDVSLFIDPHFLPEWSRGKLIGLMIKGLDGIKLPGTPYEMQGFVVAKTISAADLYQPGLRAGYDLSTDEWLVPPDKSRSHDVAREYNLDYIYALESADKMERLLRYDPDTAVRFWHQIHHRRMRDQTAGKGDFSQANIVYKMLNNRGLFPAIEQASGEHIAALDHQAVLLQNQGQNLQGLPGQINMPGYGPLQFHSHSGIQNVASSYAQSRGLPYNRPTDYRRVDPAMAAAVASEYDRMPHNPNDPQVKASYDALKRETLDQYNHAVQHGYNFEFYPQGHDPYPDSPRQAVLDLHHNKHMYVYPTHDGFGSSDDVPTDHPLLEDTGLKWGGRPVTYNDAFRAIHDFYGHAKEGLGFRADGEDNAWQQHAAMFSPLARPAMTTETRGQNSWVNFGPHGDHNRTATQDTTVYAPQKAGIMPEWTMDPNLHTS